MVQWDQWRLCSARMQAQWVKGSDMFIATARIQTLAQECPYATRAAIKKKKKKSRCSTRKKRSWRFGKISLPNEFLLCFIISQSICPKNPF